MKTTIFKFVVFLLVAMGGFVSCEKTKFADVWVCEPEPDVTITLTFDSERENVSVSTSPQDLSHYYMMYLFRDGTQCVVRENKMYPVADGIDPGDCFVITIFSSNSMELEYVGILPDIANITTVYLFNRKTK